MSFSAPEMFAAGSFVEKIPGKKPDWPDRNSPKQVKRTCIDKKEERHIMQTPHYPYLESLYFHLCISVEVPVNSIDVPPDSSIEFPVVS